LSYDLRGKRQAAIKLNLGRYSKPAVNRIGKWSQLVPSARIVTTSRGMDRRPTATSRPECNDQPVHRISESAGRLSAGKSLMTDRCRTRRSLSSVYTTRSIPSRDGAQARMRAGQASQVQHESWPARLPSRCFCIYCVRWLPELHGDRTTSTCWVRTSPGQRSTAPVDDLNCPGRGYVSAVPLRRESRKFWLRSSPMIYIRQVYVPATGRFFSQM